jgi:signal transduction histidine kinase/ligand-binding sensor domain-containing protein
LQERTIFLAMFTVARSIIRFAFILPLAAFAQPQDDQVPLRFQHLTTADGLSDNGVTSLLEDGEGYIWIGTERGLQRYDGQRMEHFGAPQGPGSIPISSLAVDSLGNIWASSTDAGLYCFHPSTRSFERFRHVPGDASTLPSDHLNHVLALNDSIVVLSTSDAGVVWFNARTHQWFSKGYVPPDRYYTKSNEDPKSRWCHSTTRLGPDRLWLGLIPGGNSYVIDAHSGEELANIRSSNADSLYSLTNAIVVDGALIAGGWGQGISRIPVDHWDQQSFAPLADEVTALVPWSNGNLLAGTKINGLIELDPMLQPLAKFKHKRGVPTSLVNDRVRCMLKDSQGNLWVGTSAGVSVHAPNVWRMRVTALFPQLDPDQPDLTFHNLQQDADGTIRISTSHGFFTLKDPGATPRFIPLRSHNVPLELTGLFPTGKDTWVVGTETGFFSYDPRKEKNADFRSDLELSRPFKQISMYQVRSVIQDTVQGKPVLVVGALGWGNLLFDPATQDILRWDGIEDTSTLGALISCTLRDAKGWYWNGSEKGVFRWRIEKQAKVESEIVFGDHGEDGNRLPSDQVTALAAHGDTVWAAMRDGALVAMVQGRAHVHQVPAHLATNLLGLAFDREGNVWCTTGNGLVRFTPSTGTWLNVPVNDGQTFRQLNRCILALRDGNIAFCADNSLITFDPAEFNALPPVPEPVLVGVKNSWGPLVPNADGRVKLPYRAGSFEAEVTALAPTGPGRMEFLYRLEGIEPDAHATAASTPLRYAGMPTGTHLLLVRTRDPYGRLGPERALLTLYVAGPFWQRWWFYALIALGASLAAWAWSRHKLRQALGLQAVRDGIARDLHDDLGSTLGSISYYSEALKRKLGPEDAVAQQVADKIGANSREMIGRMSDIVWSVDPRNDDTTSLLDRMKAHAGDLLATRGIALNYHTGRGVSERRLSTSSRRALFLIFKEALHNALKYAQCSTVEISLTSTRRTIKLSVTDNGKGFDPDNVDSYNGNGLPSMRARAEGIGGKVEVRSRPGEGTTVSVTVPLSDTITRSGD